MSYFSEFRGFCVNASDPQLQGIYDKEMKGGREAEAEIVLAVAQGRGVEIEPYKEPKEPKEPEPDWEDITDQLRTRLLAILDGDGESDPYDFCATTIDDVWAERISGMAPEYVFELLGADNDDRLGGLLPVDDCEERDEVLMELSQIVLAKFAEYLCHGDAEKRYVLYDMSQCCILMGGQGLFDSREEAEAHFDQRLTDVVIIPIYCPC